MYRNTVNNIHFYYRTNSVKIKYLFFIKLKKSYFCQFWPIFQMLGVKEVFLKPGSVTYNVISFLALPQNLEKN